MQGQFDFFGRPSDLWFIRSFLLVQFGPEPKRERGTIDDQLSGSIISSRTRDEDSWRAWLRLGAHFRGHWNLVGRASPEEILSLIPEVTFPEQKAVYLKTLWQNHPNGFTYVARMPVGQALFELERNIGVGRKVSAAALNFSDVYGRAFVADTHVLRVLRRFGFVGLHSHAMQTYAAVMMSAPEMDAGDFFELHWHLKYLGQQFCTAKEAACVCCPLSSRCMKRLEPGVRQVLRLRKPKDGV